MEAKLLDEVLETVNQQGLSDATLQSLRAAHPGVHFTLCSDDDINATRPVAEGEGFNVYLVDGRDHCLALTRELDIATGLVLAQVEEQDD